MEKGNTVMVTKSVSFTMQSRLSGYVRCVLTYYVLRLTKRASLPIDVQRGFTLIEILVVLGITGLVFASGLSSFRDFDRRQRISQSASTLRKDLDLAKAKAFASEKPSGCTTTLVGWRVTFNASSYDLIADCDVQDVTFKTVSFPSGITKTAGASSVTFGVLARGTTSSSDDTVTLTQIGTGSTTVVTITKTGTIY